MSIKYVSPTTSMRFFYHTQKVILMNGYKLTVLQCETKWTRGSSNWRNKSTVWMIFRWECDMQNSPRCCGQTVRVLHETQRHIHVVMFSRFEERWEVFDVWDISSRSSSTRWRHHPGPLTRNRLRRPFNMLIVSHWYIDDNRSNCIRDIFFSVRINFEWDISFRKITIHYIRFFMRYGKIMTLFTSLFVIKKIWWLVLESNLLEIDYQWDGNGRSAKEPSIVDGEVITIKLNLKVLLL